VPAQAQRTQGHQVLTPAVETNQPAAAPSQDAAPEAVAVPGESKAAPPALTEAGWAKAGPAPEPTAAVEPPGAQAVKTAGHFTPWPQKAHTQESLRWELLVSVPEVALEEDGAQVPKNVKEARVHIQKQAQAIAEQTKKNPDAFVQQLMAKRADLAGLPWRQAENCQLPERPALDLQMASLTIREALDASMLISSSQAGAKAVTKLHPDEVYKDVDRFWFGVHGKKNSKSANSPAMATLGQILAAENFALRLSFIDYLGSLSDPRASVALAQRAVFDLSPDVRLYAIEALRTRSAKEYLPVLLDALRYPWPAAARHAAEALAVLHLREAVPQLIGLLSEPDPGGPFLQTVQGQKVPAVRELVRVNHLRNCLLCHAPSTSDRDLVRGPIPTPGEELPASARLYYAKNSTLAMVRADVTYLKQDFSVMLPVDQHGAWPLYQRYDYLVRIRTLDPAEANLLAAQRNISKTQGLSEHTQAVLYALRALTGRDAGPSAQAWRELLGAMPGKPLQAAAP
jgi:hypothetical protein